MCYIFFFKQKTAYEVRISDWSSDVCSSDLSDPVAERFEAPKRRIVDPALGLDQPGEGSVRLEGIGLAVAGDPGHLDGELRVLAEHQQVHQELDHRLDRSDERGVGKESGST